MCTAPHSLPHLVIRVFSSSCITGLGMPSEVLELLQQWRNSLCSWPDGETSWLAGNMAVGWSVATC